jgi:hypothetical protein
MQHICQYGALDCREDNNVARVLPFVGGGFVLFGWLVGEFVIT